MHWLVKSSDMTVSCRRHDTGSGIQIWMLFIQYTNTNGTQYFLFCWIMLREEWFTFVYEVWYMYNGRGTVVYLCLLLYLNSTNKKIPNLPCITFVVSYVSWTNPSN